MMIFYNFTILAMIKKTLGIFNPLNLQRCLLATFSQKIKVIPI